MPDKITVIVIQKWTNAMLMDERTDKYQMPVSHLLAKANAIKI